MNRKEEDCLSLDPEYVLRLPDASLSFDVGLTAEERKAFVNLLDFADGQLDVSLVGKSPVFQAHVLLSGNALVRDSHDGKERALPIEDGVDLVLDTKDDEESDLPLERDGTFHLRGTFLSLLHDAIPANYSEVPLTRIDGFSFFGTNKPTFSHRQIPGAGKGKRALAKAENADKDGTFAVRRNVCEGRKWGNQRQNSFFDCHCMGESV